MAVSFRVTGTWAELTADGAVAIPATPQAGDRMYLFARWKDFSITAQVTSPSGWTKLTEFADGTTSSGNGTGSVKVACWYRNWQSGDTDPTVDFSANPTNASVVIMVMSKGAGDVWQTPIAVTAAMTNWTTTSQVVSASSTAAVPSGGVVMGLIGIRDDSSTMTRPTSGIDDSTGAITWNGNYVESPASHHSTTTGDDGAADLGYRLVTTGATATLRMTGTLSAAETGTGLWVVQGASTASPQTSTPGVLALTTATFAPTIRLNKIVTPPVTALTTTSFAPTIRLNKIATPPTVALSLSTFAPTVRTPRVVTPSTTSLSLTTFAPTVSVPSNITVTPSTAALTLTTFAPTALVPRLVSPGVRSLSLTTFAPSVRTPVVSTPTSISLSLATFAPQVVTPQVVTPGNTALTITTFAPTVMAPRVVTPTTTSLSLTTFVPDVQSTTGGDVEITPGTASLSLVTFAPIISSPRTVTPDPAVLSLTTFAPSVVTLQTVTPGTASLSLTTFSPNVSVGGPVTVSPATLSLTLTSFAPTVRVATFTAQILIVAENRIITVSSDARTVNVGAEIGRTVSVTSESRRIAIPFENRTS